MGSEPSQNNRAIRGGNIDSMYYRRPTTRMGVVWTARKAFYDAKAYQETLAGNPKADPGMQVLTRVLKGELLVFTTARAEQDIRTALRLMDEFGYKTAIEEAQEAWRVVDELVAAKVWVLVGAPSADRVLGSGAGDAADPRFHTLRLLHERGVPFVITTGSNAQALDLVREATVAVRHGLPALAALDAVTIQPARLLSVQDRIGSLSAGKDADFVVWSSNPFDPTARAEAVYVNGTRVNE
jgi:imidazolonepropionase-like amidohydrolase